MQHMQWGRKTGTQRHLIKANMACTTYSSHPLTLSNQNANYCGPLCYRRIQHPRGTATVAHCPGTCTFDSGYEVGLQISSRKVARIYKRGEVDLEKPSFW